MQVFLLRVGIDSARGGIQGPLFGDGTFEYVPIDDSLKESRQTYGNTRGLHGRMLIDYFPDAMKNRRRNTPIHYDPEFRTFTYGEGGESSTPKKTILCRLEPGSLLVLYAGLERYPERTNPGLYIIGYFEVVKAGLAANFSRRELRSDFGKNFHVRYPRVLKRQRATLVLVKGGRNSRLLKKAVLIGSTIKGKTGKRRKVLSPAMRRIFSDFHTKVDLERSVPRQVPPEFVESAARFVRSLK